MGWDDGMTGDREENDREAEALAAFTDALLEDGREVPGEDLDPDLTETVRVLGRTLRPKAAPDRLRVRLRQAIREQWPEDEREAPRGGLGLRYFLTGPRLRPARMALAVLAVAALAAVLVVSYGDVELAATAKGGVEALLWALGVGVVIAGVVAIVLGWRASSR